MGDCENYLAICFFEFVGKIVMCIMSVEADTGQNDIVETNLPY